MSIVINVSVNLGDEFISDVLVTGFDGGYGGCWYWAETAPTKWVGEDNEPHSGAYKTRGDDEWLGVHVKRREEDEPGRWVDKEVIRRGIQSLIAKEIPLRDDLYKHLTAGVLEHDAGEIDADVADCIVQAGLFNELVYG